MVKILRRRPTSPVGGRLARGMLGFGKALLGLAVPIAVIYLLIQLVVVRPADTPDRPSVDAVPTPEGPDGIAFVGGIQGEWSVVRGEDTWIGYRIEERFVRLPGPTEGAGRTDDVEGTMTVEGTTVVGVEVTGDLRTLESGDWRRDREIQLRWLEADQYPEAVFRLTEPIELGSVPEPGDIVSVEAVGDLTIREITRPVHVPLEARWDGEQAVVAGVARVVLADYDIDTPGVLSYVQAAPEADFELQLTFRRQVS